MNFTALLRSTVLAGALALAAHAGAATDASMHDVYVAAEAGKFSQAQAMMDQILRDHPNSGKAHFVEAELLAKQGKFAAAQMELASAQRLAPGLPFASAGAVQKLQTLIAGAPAAAAHPMDYAPSPARATSAGVPWGWLIVGAGLLGFIAFAVRFMGRRSAPTYGFNGANDAPLQRAPMPAPMPGYGYAGGQYGAPAAGPAPAGGLGANIMGGLATGAALGAGMVAGEALVHHFTDADRNGAGNAGNGGAAPLAVPDSNDARLRNDDMGGNDFGIADNSSWDDGGGANDDSWN